MGKSEATFRRRRWSPAAWLVMLSITVAWVGLASIPGNASCPSPRVHTQGTSFAPGDQVTVTGENWQTGCDDTGGGCIGSHSNSAYQQIRIFIRPAGGSEDGTTLATVDADPTSKEFSTTVTLPADLVAERYVIAAQANDPPSHASITFIDVTR
jgi:hypothetical protein